jgi:hypothetical protein
MANVGPSLAAFRSQAAEVQKPNDLTPGNVPAGGLSMQSLSPSFRIDTADARIAIKARAPASLNGSRCQAVIKSYVPMSSSCA